MKSWAWPLMSRCASSLEYHLDMLIGIRLLQQSSKTLMQNCALNNLCLSCRTLCFIHACSRMR